MKHCYTIFQQDFPNTWWKILETFKEVEILGEGNKMVAQCQALFWRVGKQHTQAVRSIQFLLYATLISKLKLAGMAKAHSFKAVLIMAGSVIHQDTTLGLVYSTLGMESVHFFFTVWMVIKKRADLSVW